MGGVNILHGYCCNKQDGGTTHRATYLWHCASFEGYYVVPDSLEVFLLLVGSHWSSFI